MRPSFLLLFLQNVLPILRKLLTFPKPTKLFIIQFIFSTHPYHGLAAEARDDDDALLADRSEEHRAHRAVLLDRAREDARRAECAIFDEELNRADAAPRRSFEERLGCLSGRFMTRRGGGVYSSAACLPNCSANNFTKKICH